MGAATSDDTTPTVTHDADDDGIDGYTNSYICQCGTAARQARPLPMFCWRFSGSRNDGANALWRDRTQVVVEIC